MHAGNVPQGTEAAFTAVPQQASLAPSVWPMTGPLMRGPRTLRKPASLPGSAFPLPQTSSQQQPPHPEQLPPLPHQVVRKDSSKCGVPAEPHPCLLHSIMHLPRFHRGPQSHSTHKPHAKLAQESPSVSSHPVLSGFDSKTRLCFPAPRQQAQPHP